MVSTPVKHISQIGNLPQLGVKIKNINHHLDYTVLFGRLQVLALPSNAGNPAKIRILVLLWDQFLLLAGAAPLGEGPPLAGHASSTEHPMEENPTPKRKLLVSTRFDQFWISMWQRGWHRYIRLLWCHPNILDLKQDIVQINPFEPFLHQSCSQHPPFQPRLEVCERLFSEQNTAPRPLLLGGRGRGRDLNLAGHGGEDTMHTSW